jgi:exonuclease VII large subunit
VYNYLDKSIKTKTNKYKINKIDILKINDKNIEISAIISIPENLDFYETFKKNIVNNLSKNLKRDVEIHFELLRTATFLSEKDKKIDKQKELLDNLEHKLNENLTKKLEQKKLEDRENLKKEIL